MASITDGKYDDKKLETEHAEYHGRQGTDISAEERKLVRKIDLRVLPWLCLVQALSLIDRTNISSAKIAGMAKDLKLTGNRYSLALIIFFIPYVISEIPSNIIMRKVGTRPYLAFLIVAWGSLSMCFGFVKNFDQLCVLRVLLGLFEGGFLPACVYIISSWYKRYETQQRLAVWYMTGVVISGFNGIISYGLSTLNGRGGLAGWRWIFIVPGLITVVLVVPVLLFVPELPNKAKFLTPQERELIRERLQLDRGDILEDRASWKSFIDATSDWKVHVIAFVYVFPTTAAYAMAFFIPTILESFGLSVPLSQILTTPPFILAAIVSIATGVWADRIRRRIPFIIAFCFLVIIGMVMIGWGNNTGCRLVGIFFAVIGSNCCIPALLAFLSNNVVGNGKRQVAVPMQTIYAGLGGIVGSLIFRQKDYPKYKPGLYATIGCMVACISITGGVGYYFHQENKKADNKGKVLEGLPGFRYTL